jgi:hypothetical protein
MDFSNAPYTVFAVAQATSNAALSRTTYNYILKPSATNLYTGFFGSLTNSFTTFMGSAAAWNDTAAISGTQPTSNWTMMTVVNRGTAAGLIPYINGNIRTAKTGTTVAATGYVLGEAPPGERGQNWNGDIGEVIVFNRDLSSIDALLIEGYLAAKWGLVGSLPSTHWYGSNRLTPLSASF